MSQGLRTDDLDYPFDERCIAAQPAEPRDSARMMVVERASDRVHHLHVRDIGAWLHAGDTLFVNRTRVVHARLVLRRVHDGRLLEGLLAAPMGTGRWLLLARGARKLHAGERLAMMGEDGAPAEAVTCVEKTREGWVVRFDDGVDAHAAIERAGRTPVPPYILKARGESARPDAFDRERYQTVYASDSSMHSVAAPTAGLHFTPDLLARLAAAGVRRAEITLEVGMGTFKPVETEWLAQHAMHRERFEVPMDTLAVLRDRERRGRRVVVGTTTVRALESLPDPLPEQPWRDEASLMIQPGYRFRHVDALMTNFHLPRSTLLALVGAFVGLDRLKSLYALAQREGYRFYSYGDCMLIV
jgi:S-adenosylmethionine:tRNA ribosyltransferase-isomerase